MDCRAQESWSEHHVDFCRSYPKQLVAIHQAMFQKLLFEEDA
jgi:hypothetical protein